MDTTLFKWTIIGSCFIGYLIISLVYTKLKVKNIKTALLTSNGLTLLNLKHLFGILLFGVFGYVLFPEYVYLLHQLEIPPLQILLSILLVLFISAHISVLSVKTYESQNNIVSHYQFSEAWHYLIIRVLFLVGYEFFFRGIIFYEALQLLNLTGAILLSTLFYFIIHINDSKRELLATIPFGIILCLSTYYTGTIWYAFFIHLTLSAVYEVSIFYYQTQKI